MPAMDPSTRSGQDDRERLAQLEVRVEEQGGRLIDVSQQIRNLDLKIDAQIRNLDLKIDAQIRNLDRKCDAQFQRLDMKIDALADRMDRKFDDLRSEMAKQFRWTIGVMVSLAGLFAAFGR